MEGTYYQRNREKILERRKLGYNDSKKQKNKDEYFRLKNIVFSHYNPICSCCGERQIEFLTIDHVNNDGRAERKSIGNAIRFFKKIIKEDFPSNYQILCANCNIAKSKGICPHKRNQNV